MDSIINNVIFLVVCHLIRDLIRRGLEELYNVRPGGDTFMHEGILRVRSRCIF